MDEIFLVGTTFEMDAGPGFVDMTTGKVKAESWRKCEITTASAKGRNYTFEGMGRYYDALFVLQDRLAHGKIRNIQPAS